MQETPFVIPVVEDGLKIVEGEFHTLFVREEEAVMTETTAIVDGEEIPVVREVMPSRKVFTLYISDFGHTSNSLHKVIYELRQATEYDELEIRINSDGGLVSECITLYNVMKEIFNGRVTTVIDSTAYSAGAMLFATGDERVIYSDSSLMFHNFSVGYGGKGQEIQSYIDYETKHFEQFFRDKIVRKGYLTEAEYKKMVIGQDFWFGAKEMAKRGICTHVIVDGFKLDVEAYLKFERQTKPIDEWAMKQIEKMLKEASDERDSN